MTPQEYDLLEAEAVDLLPNRITESAQAVAFRSVGYPNRVSNILGLWRFADAVQEGRIEATFNMLCGLSDDEIALVGKVTGIVAKLTKAKCHRVVIPGSSLLRAVLVYREIRNRFPDGGATIFEIGPGSGYVGALLMACDVKYEYVSTDVSQGFWLWQDMLFQQIDSDAAINHLFWWQWMQGNLGIGSADLIVANHCLNEMHFNSISFLAKQCNCLLKMKGELLVESFGSGVVRSTEETRKLLAKYGVPVFEIVKTLTGDPVGWAKIVKMWEFYGGIPESEDEKFLKVISR